MVVKLSDKFPRGPVGLDLLIGADNYGQFMKSITSAPSRDLPYVLHTTLGAALAGPIPTDRKKRKRQFVKVSRIENAFKNDRENPSMKDVGSDGRSEANVAEMGILKRKLHEKLSTAEHQKKDYRTAVLYSCH